MVGLTGRGGRESEASKTSDSLPNPGSKRGSSSFGFESEGGNVGLLDV